MLLSMFIPLTSSVCFNWLVGNRSEIAVDLKIRRGICTAASIGIIAH